MKTTDIAELELGVKNRVRLTTNSLTTAYRLAVAWGISITLLKLNHKYFKC